MAQRILIATCLVALLAIASFMGITWQRMNQDQVLRTQAATEMLEANRRLEAAFAQARATNEELLKQLQSIVKTPQSPQADAWVPVTFKLVQETLDGPPAVGYEVRLLSSSGGIFDQGILRETDASGQVDFGVVHPGDWQFRISESGDEDSLWKCQENINVLPGIKFARTIICPKTPPEQTVVALQLPWPADLAAEQLRLEARFTRAPITFQSPLKWRLVEPDDDTDQSFRILCGPGRKQTEIGGVTKLKLWNFYGGFNRASDVQRVYADLQSHGAGSESERVAMNAGSYLLDRLIVMRPCVGKNPRMKEDRFEVLAHTRRTERTRDVVCYSNDPVDGDGPLGIPSPLDGFKGGVTVNTAYWKKLAAPFSASASQVNEWTIPLPEELIKVVREELEVGETPKAK